MFKFSQLLPPPHPNPKGYENPDLWTQATCQENISLVKGRRLPGPVLGWKGLRRLLSDKQSMGAWLGTSCDQRFR